MMALFMKDTLKKTFKNRMGLISVILRAGNTRENMINKDGMGEGHTQRKNILHIMVLGKMGTCMDLQSR